MPVLFACKDVQLGKKVDDITPPYWPKSLVFHFGSKPFELYWIGSFRVD
jgi:hypothetical protein